MQSTHSNDAPDEIPSETRARSSSLVELSSRKEIALTVETLKEYTALTTPLVTPNNIVVTATEGEERLTHSIIVSQFDEGFNSLQKVITMPLEGQACWTNDLEWLDYRTAVLAQGSSYKVLTIPHDGDIDGCKIHDFGNSKMHIEDIREISIHKDNQYVISGGYDGHVHIQSFGGSHSSKILPVIASKNIGDSVSSVLWHTNRPYLASWTTDPGMLQLWDYRSDEVALSFHAHETELYCHEPIKSNYVLLGYGSGNMQVLDIRNLTRCVTLFNGEALSSVGEMMYLPEQNALFSFGIPGFSRWDVDTITSPRERDCSSNLRACFQTTDYGPLTNPAARKCSGFFLEDRASPQIAVTTGAGSFMIFDV
uniref:Uncharacterized protein n=1 Tax=Heterosigma akashiwo TaxID=2829 RepID=A0A7S3USF8_HETAK